jgi:hypothetical protein
VRHLIDKTVACLLVFMIIFSHGSSSMAAVKVTVEPEILDIARHGYPPWGGEGFMVGDYNDLAPPFRPFEYNYLEIRIAETITIDVQDISWFRWRRIPLLVLYTFVLNPQKQIQMRQFYLNIHEVGGEFQKRTLISHLAYRERLPMNHSIIIADVEAIHIVDERVTWGAQRYFDIGYFVDLQNWSASYDIWLEMSGIESNRSRLNIVLKLDGELVTRENAEELGFTLESAR